MSTWRPDFIVCNGGRPPPILGFTPESPVIFAHLVVSAAIMAPNAAGVMTIGVALTSASRVFTAESARPALISQPGQFGFRVKQGIR